MTRLYITSDLHCEFWGDDYTSPGLRTLLEDHYRDQIAKSDLSIFAGDIDYGVRSISWLASLADGKPVIFVPGNHDLWGQNADLFSRELLEEARKYPNIFPLYPGVVGPRELNLPLRVIGATLWSGLYTSGGDRKDALASRVGMSINDFRRIRTNDGAWTVRSMLEAHALDLAFLREHLGRPAPVPTVVVTHFPPSPEASPPRFAGDALQPYFVNPLEDLVKESGASLWISGHTHHCYDHMIGRTRHIGAQLDYVRDQSHLPVNPDSPRFGIHIEMPQLKKERSHRAQVR